MASTPSSCSATEGYILYNYIPVRLS